MPELKKAKEPFNFYTRMHLSELTGLKASTLRQLADILKQVPGSCIYHHTHRFLQQHQYLSPEPPNDFAYWVDEALGEDGLGEKLASINTIEYPTIRDLRDKIIQTIEDYLREDPLANLRFSRNGEEFHFIKSISFILPTKYIAHDLAEFVDILSKITIDSIYFHIFEARLRLEREGNDFSNWIKNSLNNQRLAEEIAHLDPYTHTLDDLRKRIIRIINKDISG